MLIPGCNSVNGFDRTPTRVIRGAKVVRCEWLCPFGGFRQRSVDSKGCDSTAIRQLRRSSFHKKHRYLQNGNLEILNVGVPSLHCTKAAGCAERQGVSSWHFPGLAYGSAGDEGAMSAKWLEANGFKTSHWTNTKRVATINVSTN